MFAKRWQQVASVILRNGVLALLAVGFPAAAWAQDEGEWANLGDDIADMVADNLLSWIEGPLAAEGLTISDTDQAQQPDPNTPAIIVRHDHEPNPNAPVIVIRLYVDAPFPASNKTVTIEIYPDGRVKVTIINHKLTGDETEVTWRNDAIPDAAKPWLWGPPEDHDLTNPPIDTWSEEDTVQQIKTRIRPIVEQRVYRNIADLVRAALDVLQGVRAACALL